MSGRDSVEVKLQSKDLVRALQSLKTEIQRRGIKNAGRTGARVFLDDAKDRVQVKSGGLKDDLKIRQRINFEEGKFSVGTSKKAKHAHLVELGTEAHDIPTPKGSPFSRPGGVIKHPGARPFPFLRPAFDSKWREAAEKCKAVLWKHIKKAARKASNMRTRV